MPAGRAALNMSPFSKTGLCWAESPLHLPPSSPLITRGNLSPLPSLAFPQLSSPAGALGRVRLGGPGIEILRSRERPESGVSRAGDKSEQRCSLRHSVFTGQRRSEQRLSECWHHLGLGALTVPRYSLSYHSASYLLLMEHLPTSNLSKCHSS